jgi:hypothetical protein
MSKAKTMEAYAVLLASLTSAITTALNAGVSAESIAAALDQLKTLLEED